MTVRLSPEKRTRAPLLPGWSPSPLKDTGLGQFLVVLNHCLQQLPAGQLAGLRIRGRLHKDHESH